MLPCDRRLESLLVCALWLAGCSTTTYPPGLLAPTDGSTTADGLGDVSDAPTLDVTGDLLADAATDGQMQDIAGVEETDDDDVLVVDYDLLDPPETDVATVDTAPLLPGLAVVFAHSSSLLYRLENKAFSLVGPFQFNKAAGSVTDIALDDAGQLFAVTFDDLFQCDKATAHCTWLASLPQSFNGLTFVPAGVLDVAPVLIGISLSGDWNRITVSGGTATIQWLGDYGGLASSGDAFSVEGIGTYATVTAGGSTDLLVRVDPKTGAVLANVGDTHVSGLWGLAWSGGVLYSFAEGGGVYTLDMQTGSATPISGFANLPSTSWWGAGVSTRAAQQ
ncbi:MAG: hypothetical protein ACOYOB_11430 [Myxococcota bacterium]